LGLPHRQRLLHLNRTKWASPDFPTVGQALYGRGPEIVPGWRLRLNVSNSGSAYDLLLEDVNDPKCGYAALTDERGTFAKPSPSSARSSKGGLAACGLLLCSYILGLYYASMIRFEWDQAKAKSNERKHGVRFEDAMLVFADPYALVEQDRLEGSELRWQTLGLVGGIVLLLVAHTVRNEQEGEIIRIISARRAVRKERKRYDENRKEASLG